ncbi:MAG: hypothetical protein ISR56_06570 [Bacteroidales bacterium]|nr:hypothetical protein [Bacteroidales bacterium]
MTRHIVPLLTLFETANDGTLCSKDFIKINKYYGMAVPAILGEAFCSLRGKPMSYFERWASTSQGVVTGLFDDFFDDIRLPEEHIVNMVENPELIIPNTSKEKLFLDFYLMALQKSSHPEQVIKQVKLVHQAQVASIEQENQTINKKRIWEITQKKGGDSVLFYRTIYDHLYAKDEKEALFQLGSLMQLENDIFDIYKDYKYGIATLPTTFLRVADTRSLYAEQMNLMIELCHRMDYPKKQVVQFLDRLMPVINRGFVCLDQYQHLEDNNCGVFNLASFTRKQLICDMEKPKNFFRTIFYQLTNHY